MDKEIISKREKKLKISIKWYSMMVFDVDILPQTKLFKIWNNQNPQLEIIYNNKNWGFNIGKTSEIWGRAEKNQSHCLPDTLCYEPYNSWIRFQLIACNQFHGCWHLVCPPPPALSVCTHTQMSKCIQIGRLTGAADEIPCGMRF